MNNQSTHVSPLDIHKIETMARRLFPARDTSVERVLSGISTYVYRITTRHRTYYMRILPDAAGSFAPEIMVLARLREMQVSVPEVVYCEDFNEILERPVMIETTIKGRALSRSTLTRGTYEQVAREAGRQLAHLNTLTVEGFGWMQPNRAHPVHLRAQWPTYRAFALAYRAADLDYLGRHVLKAHESRRLEQVLARYDGLLDQERAYLAHGDFDSTHIFQDRGRYTGIIDFGEIRGTNRWYDLAHFRIRDGARPAYSLFSALEQGYAEVMPIPTNYEQHLRYTSVVINIRALTRAFQTRPPDEYIWQQMEMLREDLLALVD